MVIANLVFTFAVVIDSECLFTSWFLMIAVPEKALLFFVLFSKKYLKEDRLLHLADELHLLLEDFGFFLKVLQ